MPDHPAATEGAPAHAWGASLLWGVFLGVSWTWCIGMYLPVLLVRDYGPWAFAVFALPNVLGAAGMGWVLTRPGQSEAFVARHRPACRVFSIVTLAFHVAFLSSARSWSPSPAWTIALGAFVIVMLAPLVLRPRADLALAPTVLALSAVAVAGFFGLGAPGQAGPLPDAELEESGLLFLAPVCAFGFALCPYLDLTFHRARAALDARGARRAFTLGFGVVFLGLILFTLAYAPVLTTGGVDPALLARPWMTLLIVHLAAQAAFTCAVHWRGLQDHGAGWADLGVFVALLAGALLLHRGTPSLSDDLTPREVVYRLFMAFYGLAFPAYVWLAAIPTRDGHAGLEGPAGRRKGLVLLLAVLLAAPCYWMGFVEREGVWLAPGLGVVLLARLLVRGHGPKVGLSSGVPTRPAA